jgi:hypothetical protein
MSVYIDSMIANAKSYADAAVSDTVAKVQKLTDVADIAKELNFVNGTPLWNYLEISNEAFNALDDIKNTKPEISEELITPVEIPDLVEFPEIDFSNIESIVDRVNSSINSITDFNEVPPRLDIPSTPNFIIGTAPTAQELSNVIYPTRPTLVNPTEPVLGSVNVPDSPVMDFPAFGIVAPEDNTNALSGELNFTENEYSSTLLTKVKNKLSNDLDNGSYGLEIGDETALWDRARERAMVDSQFAMTELKSQFASMNWPIPPGALKRTMEQNLLKSQWNLNDINREITSKKADLFARNREFTLQQSISLEQTLITYWNGFMERSLNAARSVVQVSIDIYNANVSRYRYQLDLYRTKADIYKTQIDKEMSRIQLYRSQMEGANLQLEVNKSNMDLYFRKFDTLKLLVDMYKTDMEASGIQLQAEKNKIEIFKAQMDGFIADIQGKTAQLGLYRAKVDGEIAKVSAYESQVKGYSSLVQSSAVKASTLENLLRVSIESSRLKLEEYRNSLDKYKTDYDVKIREKGINAELYRGEISYIQSKLSAMTAAYNVLQQANSDQFNADKLVMQESLNRARVQIEEFKTGADVKVSASGQIASVLGKKVDGALASLGTLVAQIETLEG